jgi:hypothetical protein
MKSADTIVVTVYMAGDIDTAKRWLRKRCYERGLCVTVTPTTFTYTGGEEAGFAVGFVNYPRFPTTTSKLFVRALEIAGGLLVECCQRSALVVGPTETTWVCVTPPGASDE